MSVSKHYILAPLGTHGDINPFIWIGNLLRNRGHEVTFIPLTIVEKPLENLDFKYVATNSQKEVEAVLNNPQLWHPWHGFRIMSRLAAQWAEYIFFTIQACVRSDRENIMIAPPTAFGARLAREKLGLPLGTVHLQPCAIQSSYDTLKMQRGFEWMTLGYWLWQHLFCKILPTPIDFFAGPILRRVCKSNQIAYPKRILNQWWHSPDGILCLFPNWFAQPQPDWPTPWTQAGFPLYDSSKEFEGLSDLKKFIDSGSPPILFTLGSGMKHPGNFFEVAIKACELLNRRALFITPSDVAMPPLSLTTFACKKYVPFSWLFPKIEAVVHHGGIGTIAQALAAGIPQLIVPFAFDQPDNANRLVKLGAGRTVYPSQFTTEKLSKELRFLLTNESIRTACTTSSNRFSSENPSKNTINFLENLSYIPQDNPRLSRR